MLADANWRGDLERWLEPFLDGLSHPARRRMCPLYVAGLIGPGDRKSVQPMAARSDEGGYDQLHHLWPRGSGTAALLKEADRLVGDAAGFLVIDDTASPKKGRHSVGVAPQYASALGKTANCQALVSVTLASREMPVMVGLRLFLLKTWTGDIERMKRAGVPQQTLKPFLGIALLPSPDHRPADADPLGDLQHRQTGSRQQDDLRPLDVLHRPTAVLDDPMKPSAIVSREQKQDSLSHADRLAWTDPL